MADEPLPTNNPYEAPRAEIVAEPPAASELTREEVDAFVGARGRLFWNKWRPAMKSGSLLAGFSWPAMFFNLLWLLYRKMYREFGLAFSVGVVGGVVAQLAGEREMNRFFSFAVSVSCGALGNGLYLRRARAVVGAARAAEPDPERRLALLRKKGGTSTLWPIVGAALLLALSAARRR